MPTTARRRTARAALALIGATALLARAGLAGPVPTPAWAPAVWLDVRPSSEEIELVLDSVRPVQIIPFTPASSPSRTGVVPVRVSDSGVLNAEPQAALEPGQAVGYVHVRPRSVGEAMLTIGAGSVRVRVVPSAQPAVASASQAFALEPRVLGPLESAGVWGTSAVSVGYWLLPGQTESPTIALRVSDGMIHSTLAPVWTSSPDRGPYLLASFDVDFSAFPPGDVTLTPVRTDRNGQEHVGRPVVLRSLGLRTEDIASGECEADYGLLARNEVGPPKAPPKARDADASGGSYFPNAAADPRFRFPIEVPSDLGAGWYQVVLTTAGDPAAGTLPSIGVTVNEAQRPTIVSPIARPGFHRIAIGTPIRLEPGFHVLRCDFANDFSAGRSDRNLKLDRIEVARVAGVDVQSPAPAASSAMSAEGISMDAMSGGAMSSMMSGSSGAAAGANWPANAGAGRRPPLRIALNEPIDGQIVMGEIEVRASTWQPERNPKPPLVSLVVNNRVAQSQRSDAPRFVLPTDQLKPGKNTIQLIATSDAGFVAKTIPQWIDVPSSIARSDAAPRQSARLTVHDAGWSGFTGGLKDNQGGDQRQSASIGRARRVTVALPEQLEGEFDIVLDARATGREQRVEIGVRDAAEGPVPASASASVPNWFAAHQVTPASKPGVRLFRGPKTLVLDVPSPDGKWTQARNDQTSLWLQGVRLVERPAIADTSGPAVAINHPSDGLEMFETDAIVAEVADISALDAAEVVIDGQPTGLVHDLRRGGGFGRVVVPVLLRGVAAGTHTVSLKVTDVRGNSTNSAPRTVRVLDAAPADGTAYVKAVMLLDRLAFGADARQLADVLRLGPSAYLREQLEQATGGDPSTEAATEFAALRFANARSGYDVPRRAIQEAILTGSPVRARFALWAQNHFSTWIRKTDAWRKLDEHNAFMAAGVGRFADLLRLSATSPAMLRYLDQERSYASRLNENYAREIMELHTLGVHGGYTQQDVTNLAHVLTGWTTARQALAADAEMTPDDDGLVDEFRLEPVAGSTLKEPRRVIGQEFGPDEPANRHERVLLAIEMLAAHPSTAKFVCGKLAAHYTLVTPPEELVADMASTFERTGGDMKRVLMAMVEHPAFWAACRQPRLVHPLDYALRLSRTTGWNAPWDVGDFLGASGHGLFDRPTPDGYPELDNEVIDSNAMLQRWKLASKADGAIADCVPGAIRWSDQPIDDRTAQTIVDLIAVRITGRVLGGASNRSALEILKAATPVLPARPADYVRDTQIRTVASFIAQLPEANLR